MERFKKIFAASVIFVTVLSMSVVAPQAGAVASAGDLIKMSGLSSVYYLAADGKRYVFPNESTYFSWYSDFSSVVTIPQSELESYPLGANVTVRPGTKLVKITTNPKVYAVTAGGTLVGVPDEATALTLFGANWNKRIIDISDAFFTNYKTSAATVSATAYPQGSLVKFGTSADVYLINADGTASKIASEAALTANRLKMADVITATIAMPTTGAAISGAVATLTDTSSGAGGTIGAGTGLTVALASDSPASATVITNTDTTSGNGQANVQFTKVNFTAAADGDVVVKTLKFKRVGISSDTDLDALFLYEGATRLTDAASISSNYVTFNNSSGLFTVTRGTTKAITLVGDMNFAATSGKTLGFNVIVATDVTTNGAAVSGSFPVTGNLMSTAYTSDLGRITFSGYDSTPSAANVSISPTSDQEIWKFTMASTNQELKVEKLKITAVGSINTTDLKNFKLVVSGSQIGSTVAAMSAGNVVEFDMTAAPYVIPKGGSKVVSLRADIVSGSTREFYMSFQNQQDIIVKDASYNVYIEPYKIGTFTVIKPTSTYDWYIAAGDLTISRATNSPNTDVAVDATGATLAIFDFTASGEDIKVQNLNVKAAITAVAGGAAHGGILNGIVKVDDVQVGTTKNLTEDAEINFTFGSTFIVKAGTTAKVKIIGDVKSTTSTSYTGGEKVLITLTDGSGNAQSLTSLGSLDRPATDTVGYTLNITAGALAVSKYSGYANQTMVAGTSDAKLGSFVVGAGAAEGVTVSSITVNLDASEYNSATLTRIYLVDHAVNTCGSSAVKMGDAKTPTSANNFSVSFTLAASGAKIVDLCGDIKSGANAGTWAAEVDADGTGVTTSKSVAASATDGTEIQTITIGTGTLTTTNGSMPEEAIVLAGSTGNYMAQYTFSASNEGFTIDQLQLKVAKAFATSTAGLTIKYKNKAGTVVTSPLNVFTTNDGIANATATFTGLTMYVPADDDATLDVYVDMASLSSSGASGATGAIILDNNEGFSAKGDAGTSQVYANSSATGSDFTGNSFYNRRTKPTFAKLDAGTDPVAGALFKFSVVADSAGTVEIKQLGFTFTTTTANVDDVYLYDPNTSTVITDTAVDIITSGQAAGGSYRLVVGRPATAALSGTNGDDDILSIGSTPKTYEVRGLVTGYTTSTSINVRFKQDTAATTTSAVSTMVIQGAYNIWSDRSASAHTTATTDWTNGYLLKDMTASQSFSK
jgi:hypothetical protein